MPLIAAAFIFLIHFALLAESLSDYRVTIDSAYHVSMARQWGEHWWVPWDYINFDTGGEFTKSMFCVGKDNVKSRYPRPSTNSPPVSVLGLPQRKVTILAAAAIGEKAEVTDPDQAFGQDMQQKSADDSVACSVIFPAMWRTLAPS